MQVQQEPFNCNQILRCIVFHTNLFILTTFINFLDLEQLQALAYIALEQHRQQPFYRIVIAKLFMSKYINRVDRSLFFLFYDEPDFQSIEKSTINVLAIRQYPFLEKSYHQYQDILKEIKQQTQYLETQPQFQDIIESLFFEPDLPLPKMKRETIGMYCESAFQEYLSLIRFPTQQLEDLWMQQPISQLKNVLEQQLAIITTNNTQNYNDIYNRRKIQKLRYRGFQITHQNYKQYLIQGFKMHNLIVLLLGLCSQLVFTYQTLLSNIQDPFMRFIEFQLRSAVFRNIVLAIQNKLSFVMFNYNTFYKATFSPPPNHPPLNFYRSAFSIWAINMRHFHSRNENIYNYIMTKLREQNLRQFLVQKTQKLPSFYTPLKEQFLAQSFSIPKKQQAYLQNGNKLQIQSFFENNLEMYEILGKDYLQYMVDMSVNQFTVHWCGYSEHHIKDSSFFSDFSQNIIRESANFYESIRRILYNSIPQQLKLSIFREVVKEDLQYLSERLVKPVTLKGIIEVVNQWIKQQVQNMQGYAVFGEEGFAKYRIIFDFQEKDNMLIYFGSKAKIELNCPDKLKFYYDVQVDHSAQLEKDSDDDSEQGEIALEKYESEGEGDGQMEDRLK